MEWNTKWDWENFGGYTSKAVESDIKKSDWVVIDDGGGGSSAKSSISASTDSGKMGFSTASVGNAEGLLGLKLGKRTYFENSGVIPCPPSATTTKKTKSSSQNGPPICCQVEGCNIDLSKAKEYHRKHRVCDAHSKSHRVVVGGRERRFCQQCSRFHSLSEFDEKKRSCRRRLSDHNARRRKPQQETIQFDPTRHAAPYYGGNQQMSFVLNNSSLVRTPGNCGWDSACNSKFTLTTQGYSFKYVDDQPLHMPGLKPLQGVVYTPNGLLPPKNSALLVPNPAPEFARALSLLSSNSWDSCAPESIPSHHQIHQTDSGIMQPMAHEGVPLSSSEFWLSGQHSTNSHVPSNSNFQEIQLKTPYDANFYSNILN